jgi:DNA-binding MarR family transcriptional regulator
MDNQADIRAFRRGLRRLEREIGLALAADSGCCGVTAVQCHTLLEAAERPGASLGELAECLAVDLSTMSRTVDGLTAKGWCVRTADPDNRRRLALNLSAAGRDKVDAIDERCDGAYARVLARIPEERRAAAVIAVADLAEAMRQARSPGVDGGEGLCR